LIDRDEQGRVGSEFLKSIREFDDLLNRFEIAFKENDPARGVGFQKGGQVPTHRGSRKTHHEKLADLFA
jgi:hypothetical protein